MAERNYWVLCDDNCRFPAMTKEQILTAIVQAVNEGTIRDIDTGFVTTLKTINGMALKFFVGTQSEYEALSEDDKKSVFAIITNDTSKESIERAIKTLTDKVDVIEIAVARKVIAVGEWSVEQYVSTENFIRPNTRYIVAVGGSLIEGISNAAGTSIGFGKSTGENEYIITSGGRLDFDGSGVLFANFHAMRISTSGIEAVSAAQSLTLTRVIECESI